MFNSELEDLKSKGLLRHLHWLESPQGRVVIIDGNERLNFSSNDYLGLSNRKEVVEAAIKAFHEHGIGLASSRLLSGSHLLHKRLEERIAAFKQKEAALVFTSGYSANIGVLSSLLKKGDVAFCDRLNHASIIDGLRMTNASLFFYHHRDSDHLEYFLRNAVGGRKLIVTESVFSMDGDIAHLDALSLLAEKYGTLLLIDDAHGTGVLGESGKGCMEHFHLTDCDNILLMGTLSKAVGCIGGFVAGTSSLINLLINKARSFIYTTALPPAMAAASMKALDIIETESSLRTKLFHNSRLLLSGLKEMGFETLDSETQIIPILTGEINQTLKMSSYLFNHGIYAPAIRPPTVPKGNCRLRFSITASHKQEDLEKLLSIMESIKNDKK